MAIPTFTPGYPPDNSSLGQTKSTIRDNIDGTFQTLAIDHIDNNGQPGSKPAGYHNVIHLVPQGSDPVAIPGYGQLYSKTVNSFTTDEALFWQTGMGLIAQLTVNLTPSGVTNGYTFIPGGLILQWGRVSSGDDEGTTNFNITFPSNVFVVILTSTTSAETSHANGMYWQPSADLDKFTWVQASPATSQTGFAWFAIGN